VSSTAAGAPTRRRRSAARAEVISQGDFSRAVTPRGSPAIYLRRAGSLRRNCGSPTEFRPGERQRAPGPALQDLLRPAFLLDGVGTCVRDRSGLGIHAFPPSSRSRERHRSALGRVGARVRRPRGSARTDAPPGRRRTREVRASGVAGTSASWRRYRTLGSGRIRRCSPCSSRSRLPAWRPLRSPTSSAAGARASRSPRRLSGGHE
jgi:hypothetical protein